MVNLLKLCTKKKWLCLGLWICATLGGFILLYFLYYVNEAEWNRPYPFYQSYEEWWENLKKQEYPEQTILLRQALDQYQIVAEILPHHPGYMFEYAMTAQSLSQHETDPKLRQQNLEQARKILEQAVKNSTHTAHLHLYLGQIYQSNNDWQKADRHFTIALILQSQRADILEQITLYWQERFQAEPQDIHYQVLLQFSFYCLCQQNFDKYGPYIIQFCRQHWPNLNLFDHVIPNQDIYVIKTAYCWGKLGEWQKVLAILDRLPDTAPDRHCLLGHYAMSQGEYEQAMKHYTQTMLIVQVEDKEKQLQNILEQLIHQGDFQLALEWLNNQSYLGIDSHLQLCAVAMESGNLADTLSYLHTLRQQNLEGSLDFLAESAFLLSQVYQKQGEYKLAVDWAEEMILQRPHVEKYAQHYCQLLFTLSLEGKIRDYLQIHHHYLANVDQIYQWLIQNYLNKSQYSQARYWVIQSLDLDPVSPVMRRRLEAIQQKLKNN